MFILLVGNLNRHRNTHHSSNEAPPVTSVTEEQPSTPAAKVLNKTSVQRLHNPQLPTTTTAEPTVACASLSLESGSVERVKKAEMSDTTAPKKKRKAVAPRKTKNNERTRSPELTPATVDSASNKILHDLIELGLTIGSSSGQTNCSQTVATTTCSMYGRLSESDDSNMSPSKVTSTRRKKKTVAKTTLGQQFEEDDVEKEWQEKMPSLTEVLPSASLQQELTCDFSPFSDNSVCEADQLSSVLGELRRLKDSVSMGELMGSDNLTFSREHSDLFEMEVDEHGRPRDLVTILHL